MRSAGGVRPDWSWLKDPGHFLALGGGTGLVKVAPGTFGSLLGVALYLALPPLGPAAAAGVVALMIAVGVPICGRTARALGVHDHPAIVWDEVTGVVLTLVCGSGTWIAVGLGFLLFRIFDIWKPWPVRWADGRVGGGIGVMLDDLLAAAYAAMGLVLFEYISYS
ncbi:MAG TPA: phosphatidylglycerophosphatase A [Gammaproteobacteria bacterium]|nr:phosphatidylglycerophosphatase A [Gammaproteobacteria bacterium]